jgi:splicing factor 3A subunit 3
MATLLEQTRGAHEEIERLERLIVAELSREARSHRERLAQGHRVGAMVDRIAARAGKLVRGAVWPAPAARRTHGCAGCALMPRGSVLLRLRRSLPLEG